MQTSAFDAAELISRLQQNKIDIDLVNGQLKLNIPKGLNADDILSEIRTNKQELITHLKTEKQPAEIPRIEHEGEYYYEITKFQDYWVNESKDREYKKTDSMHGSILSVNEILGSFDAEVFRKCVSEVVRRHESLRATFHTVQGKNRMRVENTNLSRYDVAFKETAGSKEEVEDFIRFSDHCFSLSQGPLFLARVLRVEKEKHLIGLKLHHVISDTVSTRVLVEELLVLYNAYINNTSARLPVLNSQYKEYLSMINAYIRRNYNDHKKYWQGLYNTLPPELIIPGAKQEDTPPHEKLTGLASFYFDEETFRKIRALAGELSVSFFIILQASFKKFLCHATGQSDIAIGTSIAGRDHEGAQYQVGCYAKTMLIRTVFNPADTFRQLVEKVKQSNSDMRTYQAFSLYDALRGLRPAGYKGSAHFQKINMYYEDNTSIENAGAQEGSPDEVLLVPVKRNVNSHVPIDLQLFFFASPKRLELEVQYDSSLYTAQAINKLVADYFNYANALLSIS